MISRKNDRLIVREPYKNYPADKAGLKAGDEIIQIGDVLIADFKDDASQLLKGTKNTKINIKYLRQGKPNTTVLVLDEVDIKSVPFYGAKQIVLDLRGNPGGLLNEAIDICNLFVPKNEVIVTTKSRIEKHNNTYKTQKEPVDTEIPLAILVNGRSASASEIVSGALQDLDRAVILGSRSFGKGLVQRSVDLTYGTQLKVTISRYYTPSGRCIQALDYAHKDKNGVAQKTEAKNFNAFKTRKGRTVYDGGGVLPDIELEETKISPIATALTKNDGVFDYATSYYYKNPNLGDKIPTLTDADYAAFKQFLKTNKITFDTETEVALKNTLAAAKKEKIDETITAEYQQLLNALEKSETTLLDKNQKEIKNMILEELIKRYQYQEGLYQYYLKNNSEIKRAVSVLNNQTEYKTILKM